MDGNVLTRSAHPDTLGAFPMETPSHFERARESAATRPPEQVSPRRLDAFRRAVSQVFGEQIPLMTKILADGKVDSDEQAALDEAIARLSRYYGLALSFRGEGPIETSVEVLRSAIEEHARALGLTIDGKADEAKASWHKAGELLRSLPLSPEPGDPRIIHSEAEVVYDRATGRSKYDADSEGWLSFALRCPNEACRGLRPYRLLPRHPTHKFSCSACGVGFLLFVATVERAERNLRHSSATHSILARGADGANHQLVFDHSLTDDGDVEMKPGDLVLFTYDTSGRLRLVRNYTRGKELKVTSDGRCFVATAAMGPFAPEVLVLRRHRDDVLLNYATGRAFVTFYQWSSPPLARLIERRPLLRRTARVLVRLAARTVGRFSYWPKEIRPH